MKEDNEQSFKAVEPKKSLFGKSESKVEKPAALIAKKGLKHSSASGSWSVKAGDNVSAFDESKLAILRKNGAI